VLLLFPDPPRHEMSPRFATAFHQASSTGELRSKRFLAGSAGGGGTQGDASGHRAAGVLRRSREKQPNATKVKSVAACRACAKKS